MTVDVGEFLTFIKQKIAEGWTMSQKCSHDPIAVMDYHRMGPESRVQSWWSPVWSLNPDIESILNQATFFVCLFVFIIMFKNIFLLFYSRKKCARMTKRAPLLLPGLREGAPVPEAGAEPCRSPSCEIVTVHLVPFTLLLLTRMTVESRNLLTFSYWSMF